jgi:hypothetical protein
MKPLRVALAICTISTLAGCGTSSPASPTLHNAMGSYTLSDCSDGDSLNPSSIKVVFTNTTSATESVLITLSDSNGFLLSEVALSEAAIFYGGFTGTPQVHVRPGGSFSQVLYIPSESDLCAAHPYVSGTTG